MKLAITGKVTALEKAPFVLRGPYEEIIPAAASIGYDAIELHIDDSAHLDRPLIRRLLADSGIGLSSIGTGTAYSQDRLFLSSEDEAIRRKAIRRIEDHIDTAKEHGAVVIVGLVKGQIKDCSSREACVRNLGESLTELVKKAEADDAPLVFEVINRYESDFLTSIDEALDFLTPFNSRHLLLHIDTFHMNIEEASIPASIRRAHGMIGHCHVADSDRWHAGHGHYDFAETIQALRDIGYTRALSVESYQFPDPLTSAAESFKTLKALL